MATVNPNQEEEQQGQGNPNQNGSSSVTPIASATPQTASSSTGSSTSSKPAYNPSTATSSGNFTNLKSYLNANNNGQDFSNQVNQNLQQQGTDLGNNIQGATNQFNNQVQSVVTPVQQNYQAYQQIAANNDPNAIVNYANQGNGQNIQDLENVKYTGPQTLNNLTGNYNGAALQSQVGNYQDLAKNTGSEAGRMNLLQSLYGNQNYNQGQQTLDNVFLQGNNFGNTISQSNQLNNQYNSAANNAATSAQNAQNLVNNAATGTVNSLNSAVNNQNTNVQGEVQQAINNQQSLMHNFINNYNNGKISAADAAALGITSGADTYNLDPNQFITQGITPNAQNVATNQDYSKFNTLQNLLGNNANTQASAILSGFQDNSQSGKLGNPYSLDQTGYQAALASAQDAYNQAINPVQKELGSLEGGYSESPYTYQGKSGNGWLGALNDVANQLKTSGFTANIPGAENMSNEDLVRLAEQSGGVYGAGSGGIYTGGDATAQNPNAVNLSNYLSPYYLSDLQKFGVNSSNNPTAFTDLVDSYQQKIAAQKSALENLANQYGANKGLSIE